MAGRSFLAYPVSFEYTFPKFRSIGPDPKGIGVDRKEANQFRFDLLFLTGMNELFFYQLSVEPVKILQFFLCIR
jgi:hypothetical protein